MIKKLFPLVMALGFAAQGIAADSTSINYRKALAAVPALELPAKASELVRQAPADDREIVTSAVVNNVAGLKPAALPAVVGAIAKAVPDMAATAAAVAASARPKLAVDVAKAAAKAAPSETVAIVAAVNKALPTQARDVALAVAAMSSPEVATKLVEMANQATASTTTASTTRSSTLPPRPPTIGPAYNPLPTGTSGQGSVNNSGAVLPGGSDYSAP